MPTKVERQWPAGEDRRVALATSGSTRFRRMPTPYRCLRCEDLRSPGVMEWSNGPLGLRDDDDDDDDDVSCMSHCCCQDGHPARVAHVQRQ